MRLIYIRLTNQMFIKPLSQLEIVVVAVKSELVKYLLGGGGGGGGGSYQVGGGMSGMLNTYLGMNNVLHDFAEMQKVLHYWVFTDMV
jgi:hypothetical protein